MITNASILGPIKHGDYHKQDVQRGDPAYIMSQSELKVFNENPWKWRNGYRLKPSKEMSFGSLVDCLLLTPDDYASRFVVQPATYPAAKGEEKPWSNNATFCRDWNAEQKAKGLTVISPYELDAANFIREKAAQHPVIGTVLFGCESQVAISAVWQDESGIKVPLRGCIDIAPVGKFETWLFDLKVYASANPRQWANSVFDHALDVQAAMYLDIWNNVSRFVGTPRNAFGHIIVEPDAPFFMCPRMLSTSFIEAGREKYESALRLYCQCLKENKWPGYSEQTLEETEIGICEPSAYML